MYEYLIKESHKIRRYGESVMQATAELFLKWRSELLKKVMYKDRIEHKMRVVPVLFCSMRYVKDVRNLPGYTSLETQRLKYPRENNVQVFSR